VIDPEERTSLIDPYECLPIHQMKKAFKKKYGGSVGMSVCAMIFLLLAL